MKFCPECGNRLNLIEIISEGLIPKCENCNQLYFPHSPACIIAIIKLNGKLLLIKQDYLGDKFCLVAGHIKETATVEQTLEEEIFEEVGLSIKNFTYLGSFYHHNSKNLMLGFFADCTGDVVLNDEVESYELMGIASAMDALKGRTAGWYFLNLAKDRGLLDDC